MLATLSIAKISKTVGVFSNGFNSTRRSLFIPIDSFNAATAITGTIGSAAQLSDIAFGSTLNLGTGALVADTLTSTSGSATITAGTGTLSILATTVGGAWAATAGANVELTANGNLSINVGGAVALTGASVVLKVGGSNVTLSGGTVVITSSEIKLTATGPQPELAPMVADK